MVALPCLAVGFLMKLVAFLFVLTCIALVLIILIQKGRGGGLSSAFGGGMTGGVLGSKTGDFLTWVTISLVGLFLLLAVLLAKYYKPSSGEYGPEQSPPSQQTATEPNVPASSIPDMNAPEVNAPMPDANMAMPAETETIPEPAGEPNMN